MHLDTESTQGSPGGVFGAVKNLAASVVSHLCTRLELFATELAEEKLRLTSLLASVIAALFFLFLAIFLAAMFIIVAYWDTPYRLHAVGALTLVFLASAGIFWAMVFVKIKSKPYLFRASLAELYNDRKQLDPRRAGSGTRK